MSRRAKGWLVGGWLVLVVAGWSVTESMNDGIEPTSGPRPGPSSSASLVKCAAPTPTPNKVPTKMPTYTPIPPPAGVEGSDLTDYHVDATPDLVATAIACKAAD
ncbi:hypothetical protein [Streptomyces shaanxiensis]|uniref:Uncharacterized protein n=1 Tax=Streptomyces shaanxiensis TaxID=653357 RepID=A0ABP7UIX9_9ACTN